VNPAGSNERVRPSPDRVPLRTIYLALLVISLFAYRGILDDWLFNDDFSWLKAARFDMTPGNLLTFRVVEFFRPLVNLSFWAMEKMDPGNVTMHYAFNLLLHILCTFMVFRLARKLLDGIWLAAAAAALFAVTSVHAAAVLWISARTTLLATFFLLAAIDVAASGRGRGAVRTAGSAVLYVFALASKEEAIAGLFLVPLLHAFSRRPDGRRMVSRGAVVSCTAVSIAYLAGRQAVMGGFVRENWGPGFHALRNVAGGFLDQLYPWPFFSLFYRRGTVIPEASSAFSPEIAAVAIAVLLVLAGYLSRRLSAMGVALGWALLALVPASFFRYRFFSTVSITQNRYYYLSSVGTVMIAALLIALVWKERSRVRQGLTVALFVLICAGYMVRDARLERKWGDFTGMYREIVTSVVEECSKFPGVATVAVEGSPLAFPYLADAVALERPRWKVLPVTGGVEAAARYAPCLYVSFRGEAPRIMRVEEIRR
jgi:hypothetical protein